MTQQLVLQFDQDSAIGLPEAPRPYLVPEGSCTDCCWLRCIGVAMHLVAEFAENLCLQNIGGCLLLNEGTVIVKLSTATLSTHKLSALAPS